jgi:hypothetical protein
MESNLRQDYFDIFSTPQGKRVLNDLHMFCGDDDSLEPFDPQNSHNTAYKLGALAVTRRIRFMCKVPKEGPSDAITEHGQKE